MVLPLGLDVTGLVTTLVFIKQMAGQAENDHGKNKYAYDSEHGFLVPYNDDCVTARHGQQEQNAVSAQSRLSTDVLI